MSHISTKKATTKQNFLASAVGLVLKTTTIAADGVDVDEYGNKIVPAGTIIPANDATAKGILFEDVDVTQGDHEGSIVVAGRILEARLEDEVEEDAKAALKASGIVFASADETDRTIS